MYYQIKNKIYSKIRLSQQIFLLSMVLFSLILFSAFMSEISYAENYDEVKTHYEFPSQINQQINDIEYYPNYSNPDFDYITTYQKTESNMETNHIYNNSNFSFQIMTLIQQIASENYQRGYNEGYQDGLNKSTYPPEPTRYPNYDEQESKYDSSITNEYQIPTDNYLVPIKDYSKLCSDEYGNWQEPTIEISASATWKKDSTLAAPISASGIIKNEYDSAVIIISGSDGIGLVYESKINPDGIIWKHLTQQEMFSDQFLYGDYSIEVLYENQCGMTTINYHR